MNDAWITVDRIVAPSLFGARYWNTRARKDYEPGPHAGVLWHLYDAAGHVDRIGSKDDTWDATETEARLAAGIFWIALANRLSIEPLPGLQVPKWLADRYASLDGKYVYERAFQRGQHYAELLPRYEIPNPARRRSVAQHILHNYRALV